MDERHDWVEVVGEVALTDRELEVLQLKSRRRTNAEIAQQLVISLATVKWHVGQIYSKLGVGNRAEAVATARHLGLLEHRRESKPRPFNNVPVPLTPFVGREKELGKLAYLLGNERARLVTINGPGGIGKTRLAIAAAVMLGEAFRDGICWVSFAAQDQAEYVYATVDEYIATAITAVLELSLGHGEDPLEALTAYLRQKEMLIILDSLEHLLDGAPAVARLLREMDRCSVLVTSRERLDLAGERLFAIAGLALGEEGQEDGGLGDAESLFVQAAQRVTGNRLLDAPTLSTIRTICMRLEGMPLAIELAADWTRVLTVAEVESELERGLPFLQSRQLTMHAVIDRSWRTLAEEQRVAFARLAVFQQGFSREAAEQVTGIDLYTLSALFDKSLLQHAGDGRFRMHDLLRQFAAEQLLERGEHETMRDAHCAYFAALVAGQMEPIYRGDHSQMLADLDNIRAAWRWGVQRRRLGDLNEMVFPLDWFYNLRALYVEAVGAMQLAMDALRTPEPEGLSGIVYAKALAGYALEQSKIKGTDHAAPYVSESVRLLRRLGARRDLAWQLVLAFLRDPDDRMAAKQESLAIFEEIEDRYGMAFALAVLGSIYRDNGRYAEARLSIERALGISRSLGDPEGIGHALRRLGYLDLHVGNFAEAQTNFREEARLWRALGLLRLEGEALGSLGETYLAAGDLDAAQQTLLGSLAQFEELGDEENALASLFGLVELAWLRRKPRAAHGLLRDARVILERRSDSYDQARYWQLSGRVYLLQGDAETAWLAFSDALEHSLEAGGVSFLETLLGFAEWHSDQGKEKLSARLLGYARAQEGLPAALRRWRIEPLRARLETGLGPEAVAALIAEGAALQQDVIINWLRQET